MKLSVEVFGSPLFSVSIGSDEPSLVELVQNAGGDFQIAEPIPFGFVTPDEDE